MLGSRSRPATTSGPTSSFVLDSGASSWDSLSPLAGLAGDEVEPGGRTQHADEEEFDAVSMDTKPDAIPLRTAPGAKPLQTAPGAELRNEPASIIITQIGEQSFNNLISGRESDHCMARKLKGEEKNF